MGILQLQLIRSVVLSSCCLPCGAPALTVVGQLLLLLEIWLGDCPLSGLGFDGGGCCALS